MGSRSRKKDVRLIDKHDVAQLEPLVTNSVPVGTSGAVAGIGIMVVAAANGAWVPPVPIQYFYRKRRVPSARE